MARRSSARLANRKSTTPKRVSLSHDAPTTRTPRTVPAKLSSLQESDEMPGAFPDSPSMVSYPDLKQSLPQSMSTPRKGTPIKPSEQEMHPQLHHQTTAKPREEARHLGFSSMPPHTEPPKQKGPLAALQATPSRTRNLENDLKSPAFHFTFRREHSLELSPEAKTLMNEQREKAALIREQMLSSGEGVQSIDQMVAARRIAQPKGRFSQAHLKEFEKMESIAGHASAFRADPSRLKAVTEKRDETKSLKRSPSKARLDEPDTPSSRPTSREGPKPTPSFKGSGLPRSTSTKDLKSAVAAAPRSPTKRIKRAETDDVSANRPPSSESDKSLPSTPKQLQSKASAPNLAALTTPTQASLARAASVKSTKTSKIPAPQLSLAKLSAAAPIAMPAAIQSTPIKAAPAEQKTATPLLAKSPSKASLFATKPTVTAPVEQPSSMMSAALARSPIKSGMSKRMGAEQNAEEMPKEKPVPFLSRSPVKAAVSQASKEESSHEQNTTTPFLARSPTKLPMASAPVTETPDKSASSKLMGRFNLLRQSPMKSILRTPQRLYSEDPAKVAAGTHLATPPGQRAADLNKTLPAAPHTASHTSKKVDFSSSTKARDLKSQERQSSESKTPTPSPKSERTVSMVPQPEPEAVSNAPAYPTLPLEVPTYDRMPSLSPSPQKRRQTAGPQDFTFRADHHGIIFGQSPNAPASEAQRQRPSTIRHVSADVVPSPAPITGSKKRKFAFENHAATASKDEIVSPAQGTKKRKFEFENKMAAANADSDVEITSDKENTPALPEAEEQEEEEEHRPAKRAKTSAPSPKMTTIKKPSAATAPTAASAARRTTLGVKPKGAKTTSPVKKTTARSGTTISQSRLAALSQPKKRN
ncbi:uncharacterized protein MYCFIDRAFT_191743 [Pseudocercospora fijiensis CIRAD86]|uniref:Erythromycin esterase n=1 Tax=Pseudocercospora fijiensis (strain CIRAD86) TaxID=383855 RepID=N1Q6Z6_PSEFD|nr:uncharacterized protein MYCFIDRAFT_191743 [Pseudocercospora fijiensis CIRAD86]EME87251.1 hypothetical protein MYCFIDRAFT_191743 [Pseudocercospora fijiensis CIRAD86]